MLTELRVSDLALVSSARVVFGPGLNLLTGETGSGKSLIVDALGLALGGRASSGQIRHGAATAVIDAAFRVTDANALQVIVEMGFEVGSELVLTREVGSTGRARVNGRPATPAQLRRIGSVLVGIHGQHEQQALLDAEAQTVLLDAFAAAGELRAGVAQAHASWTRAQRELSDLLQLRARGQREQEYLRWQLEELVAANLEPGEEEALAAQRGVFRHATRLEELTTQAAGAIQEEEAIARAVSTLMTASELDGRLEPILARLQAASDEVSEAGAELRRYSELLEADPGRLEDIEGRLSVLDSIRRKYGGSLDAAIAERERLAAQVAQTVDLESAVARAEDEVGGARDRLQQAAASLTATRLDAAAGLARAVGSELGDLRLEDARFGVELEARPEVGPAGAEVAQMMFSANPGEPLAPLARVASGGELARVMLAIKTVGAAVEEIGTLIFDEVDTGIGGETALQVGLRLRNLGGDRQVLVVTHLAQIAAFADHHLQVSKAAGADGRNLVAIEHLSSRSERASELARMMGGAVTPKALARAEELLDSAGSAG